MSIEAATVNLEYLAQQLIPLVGVVQAQAVVDTLIERARQDRRWGEQNHAPFVYGAVLVEEVGEFMQAALKARFESFPAGARGVHQALADRMREEAVQVAAVALAIVECLDRDRWPWGSAALPDPERDSEVRA